MGVDWVLSTCKSPSDVSVENGAVQFWLVSSEVAAVTLALRINSEWAARARSACLFKWLYFQIFKFIGISDRFVLCPAKYCDGVFKTGSSFWIPVRIEFVEAQGNALSVLGSLKGIKFN